MLYDSIKDSELLILEELKNGLNIKERILLLLFKKYVLKIYRKGIIKGFNWENRWHCQRFVNYNQDLQKYNGM